MKLLFTLGAPAILLSGCATANYGAAPETAISERPAPPLATADVNEAAAPDSMRWLYGSGEAAGASIQTWRMLADYGDRIASGPRPAQSVAMGLPGRESSEGVATASCTRADGSAKPLAVVFDVDETVILNEGYEYHLATGHTYSRDSWKVWEETGSRYVSPVPGAVTGLRRLRDAGIIPVFNTNRQFSADGAARAIAAAGLGEVTHGETLFLRGDDGTSSSGKDGRRALIAEKYCVIALAGDNLGDFADVFNNDTLPVQQRRAMAARGTLAQMWGNGWFALPNPAYGDLIKGSIGDVFPPASRWNPETAPSSAPAIMNESK